MCNDNKSCPVVVHVVNRRCRRRADLFIDRALRAAKTRGEVSLWRIDSADTAHKIIDLTARRSPDAVIAPRRLHTRLAEHLRPGCSLFDFDWVLEGDHSKIFVDIPGTGRGFFDETGRIGLGGFMGADRFPWDNVDRLLGGFRKTFGPGMSSIRPPLHGRWADGGLTGFAIGVGASLAAAALWELGKWGYEKVVEEGKAMGEKMGQETMIDIGLERQAEEMRATSVPITVNGVPIKEKEATEEEEDEDWGITVELSEKKTDKEAEETTAGAPEGGTEQEPDDSGRDFLRAIVEFYEKTRLDALWQAMLQGRVPPEQTDKRDEFLYWLERTGAGDARARQRLREGMPTLEDDETGFALLYWMWMKAGAASVRESKLHEYLLRKGAPIDPIERGKAGQVRSADGEWNAVTRRLRLRFWA